MKKIFFILVIAASASCNQPIEVTARPDPHTSTSGTLGSARHTNQMPERDTNKKLPFDTLRIVKDSL